jgi:hypothetical protein
MRGDGTLELTPIAAGSSKAPAAVQEESVSTFSVQAFNDIEAVSWDRSSTLTKLVTVATVCNKAKFVYTDEGSGVLSGQHLGCASIVVAKCLLANCLLATNQYFDWGC